MLVIGSAVSLSKEGAQRRYEKFDFFGLKVSGKE